MKVAIKTLLIIVFSVTILHCYAQKSNPFKPKVVYKSDDLIVTQISKNSFEHTSFLQTDDFGNVPCNGLIVSNSNEAIVFDTPTNDKSSEELIKWIKETLHCKINAIIPTHFHNDCLGGLKAFDNNNIPSYAYFKTIALAKENNFAVPKNSFRDSLILKVGNKNIIAKFFGEGHTKDNVVGYFPSENIMFGGCLIKELDANKGYLGDANVAAWSNTVEKVKQEYPNVKIVIPGHGEYGNKKLLDYTINLFKTK
ncbi:subclass B1 metallo-beta-lactamase [Chitinophaga ginsengisegetis]|uniref:subclass B1 metallo-beta-lactamase n=1 Tax=Chitinophaga ginsengisegetis TaxID=393003 RepID=UPI000DBA06C0|nr:subclass B1 metallo-beta-lactamase [Chitinophaga ginsengisegetis]MDR6569135.1 metallo-beta-lactamase class B [Chitinophaga ginsengisegetis]MDR6648836.1 metallo-beta-lactamase class B [Chitinophaga ginsengisegetis]MDR6655216.1 metallo-beta-lactamase class B [Chitinophaga ginsengisegetis]